MSRRTPSSGGPRRACAAGRVRRVLVIGAGHNGLVAAIHLASRGLEVTVLEFGSSPGGASRSGEVTLPGFVHDHCAAFVPMAAASPAIRELELEREGLVWIDPPHVLAHPFDDGSAIALERDLAATVASLGAAGAAWGEAMEQMLPLAGALVRTVLSPLPPVRPLARLVRGLGPDMPRWTRRLLGSVQALGLELFDGDARAAAWLAGSAQHTGLPPSTSASGAFGFLLNTLAHSHGWPLPRGGMGELSGALARRAEREGAQMRCSTPVERILISGERVCGVRTAGGESIAADAVVSTVSAGVLARLLAGHELAGALSSWRYGTGAFKLDYALDGPVPWTAAEPRRAAVVHLGATLEELVAAAEAGGRGQVPERPAVVVGQQSLLDPTRAPEGKHTLYAYAHVPGEYELPDAHVAARIEAQLERFAPGFSELVLARSVRSPRQGERENPSLVGGDIAGGSYELDQQLVFRPSPLLWRYRTPIRGLFVAGASTHPGGAIHGVSGRGAAHALLRDSRLVPRLRALARR